MRLLWSNLLLQQRLRRWPPFFILLFIRVIQAFIPITHPTSSSSTSTSSASPSCIPSPEAILRSGGATVECQCYRSYNKRIASWQPSSSSKSSGVRMMTMAAASNTSGEDEEDDDDTDPPLSSEEAAVVEHITRARDDYKKLLAIAEESNLDLYSDDCLKLLMKR